MGVQIFQYKESQLEEIRIILNEFLSFIANELNKPPWDFNLNVEHELDFTMNNLDKFAKPDGRLLLVEVGERYYLVVRGSFLNRLEWTISM